MQHIVDDFFSFGLTNKLFDSPNLVDDYRLDSTPLVSGKKVKIEEAISELEYLIKANNSFHFDGLICDQKSIDSIFNFAERLNASITHYENDEINNFYQAYQKYGGYLVSYNELRKRADLVILLGNFDEFLLTRFFKKIGWSKKKIRENIYLFSQRKFDLIKHNFKINKLDYAANFIYEIFKKNEKDKKFEILKKKLEKSNYPVIVVNPKNGFMYSQNIFKTLELINNNEKTLKLFKLSGLNNSSGFVVSSVSKTGFPGSINFTDWGASYDPIAYNAFNLKKKKDIQIFFSNLRFDPEVINFKKNVFIGHPNFSNKNNFDIFIPVKTPGIDTNGIIVRSDGTAVMKLPKKIESDYPEINQIVNKIVLKK